jgi:DNA-binding CsgD family transcriptional regulator
LAKPGKVGGGAILAFGFDILTIAGDRQDTDEPEPNESGQNQARSILTTGERRVLLWCGNGKTSFEISRILGLSEHTVNHYIASAVRKLDATNRTHAIAKAIKMNIVDISDIN